jgi:membrane-bound lytic murein transglycosylase B
LNALKILQAQRIPRQKFLGSFAGAMGQPQFMVELSEIRR